MVKKTKIASYGQSFAMPIGTAAFTQFIAKVNMDQGMFPSKKYEINVAYKLKETDFSVMKEKILEVARVAFDDPKITLADLTSTPIKSGDEEMDTDKYPIFKDAVFVQPKRKEAAGAPPICDLYTKDGKLQTLPPEKIYGGCKVRLYVTAGAAKIDGKKQVWFDLDAIQFVADGDRIGGNSKAELASLITANSSQESIADVLLGGEKEEEPASAVSPIDILPPKGKGKAKEEEKAVKKPSLLDTI